MVYCLFGFVCVAFRLLVGLAVAVACGVDCVFSGYFVVVWYW